jgi:1-acyl-sn-glycerol-3-phosphate acyltransferase
MTHQEMTRPEMTPERFARSGDTVATDPLSTMRISDRTYDVFGRDTDLVERLAPTLDRLLDDVFGIEMSGLEHMPTSGRAILVGNHAGAFPWDAIVLARAIERSAARRTVRPLLEDPVMTAPFVGTLMTRMGCVRASQENAMRLLARDELIAVFPEGTLGLSKLYKHRYQLVRFGRGGFVKLAHRANAPLLPVAILGAEDASPLLAKLPGFFRGTLGSYLPVTPTFPVLGPLGLLPLPARWSIHICPPVDVRELIDDADDPVRTTDVASALRATVQKELDRLREARTETWRMRLPRGLLGGRHG